MVRPCTDVKQRDAEDSVRPGGREGSENHFLSEVGVALTRANPSSRMRTPDPESDARSALTLPLPASSFATCRLRTSVAPASRLRRSQGSGGGEGLGPHARLALFTQIYAASITEQWVRYFAGSFLPF